MSHGVETFKQRLEIKKYGRRSSRENGSQEIFHEDGEGK